MFFKGRIIIFAVITISLLLGRTFLCSGKFIKDRETGRFRGIAFVEMEDAAAAAKAISELDGAEFFGRQMVVKEARPPKY